MVSDPRRKQLSFAPSQLNSANIPLGHFTPSGGETGSETSFINTQGINAS
jgi:hypothetical protein